MANLGFKPQGDYARNKLADLLLRTIEAPGGMIEESESPKDSILGANRNPQRGAAGKVEGRQQGVESIPIVGNDDPPWLPTQVFAERGWQVFGCFKIAASAVINSHRSDVVEWRRGPRIEDHAACLQQFPRALQRTKKKILLGATERRCRAGSDQRVANLFN